MSLQEMAWLTQGPMAAADLELDIDSMEQEVIEEHWALPPSEHSLGPVPRDCLGNVSGDSLVSVSRDSLRRRWSGGSLGSLPGEDIRKAPVDSQDRGYKDSQISVPGDSLEPVPGDSLGIPNGDALSSEAHTSGFLLDSDIMDSLDTLPRESLEIDPIIGDSPGKGSLGAMQCGKAPAAISGSARALETSSTEASPKTARSIKDTLTVQRVRRVGENSYLGDHRRGEHAGQVKQPPWKTTQAKGQGYGRDGSSDILGQSTPTDMHKFGAIKVHAGILDPKEELKSFVVTNETTTSELITLVLDSYNVVCENNTVFTLVLEKTNKRFGFTTGQRTIKLQDSSKPLELQSRYNRGDIRFRLHLRPCAGILQVHNTFTKTQASTENKMVAQNVFVTDKTSCHDVIRLVLSVSPNDEPALDFSLFEVNSTSKDCHELGEEHVPLVIQRQWVDPKAYYFEIRRKVAPPPAHKMRRHSIDTVRGVGGGRQSHPGVGPSCPANTPSATTRSLIPRIKRGGSSGNLTNISTRGGGSISPRKGSTSQQPAGQSEKQDGGAHVAPPSSERETTMAKLKDSLSKLREHLDNLQRRKTMSFDSGEEALHVPHGDGPRISDSSDENCGIVRDISKAEVTSSYQQQGCGYETGETSLNESDAGSMRGNNDSAYASDRMSHTSVTSHSVTSISYTKATSQGNTVHHGGSSFQRRRVRRGSYTSSDQSSPEYPATPLRGAGHQVQLRKTQSLYELQRGQPDAAACQVPAKPARMRSTSHAPPSKDNRKQVPVPGRRNGNMSGSDEQLNTWARRKQYDIRRRTIGAEPMLMMSTGDPVKRSQSFQDIKPSVTPRGRPTSAGHDRSISQLSGSSSGSRGPGVKMRRTLPKVPVGAEADIEERRKRMSAEIIRRARAGVSADSMGQLTLSKGGIVNGHMNSERRDHHGSQASLEDNTRVPVIHCSPETISSSQEDSKRPGITRSEPYMGQVLAPQPKYGSADSQSTNTNTYLNSSSTDIQNLTNGHDTPDTDLDDMYSEVHGTIQAKKPLSQCGESSQEALQRIINDLRNAATKPYEGSTSSRGGSRSSTSSLTQEYRSETAEEQAEVVYSQLAQWGVLQPSMEDLSSQKYYSNQYPTSTQPTSNEEEEEEPEEDDVAGELEEHVDSQLDDTFYQSSQAYSKSSRTSRTNESISSVSNHSELRVEHPTIHRVLRSCDLVRATLERCDIFTEFGFEIFESTFYDNVGKGRSKRAVFRTPSGRRPLLGRRKGAFIPVAPVNQTNPEAGPLLSLVAVDNVMDGSPADKCGTLQEGDYVIEVNGLYVVDADVERVRSEFMEAGNCLDLVLARPHEMGVDRLQNEEGAVSAEVKKDLERLRLKYDAMKQDAERSQDTIADLKIDLKDRNQQLSQLDIDLRLRDEQFKVIETTLRSKDDEVAEWKFEANHRNVELARLKYEAKQKDDRIAQLRRLLIQQTELMQMHQGRSANGTDVEDFEEHVSAV